MKVGSDFGENSDHRVDQILDQVLNYDGRRKDGGRTDGWPDERTGGRLKDGRTEDRTDGRRG